MGRRRWYGAIITAGKVSGKTSSRQGFYHEKGLQSANECYDSPGANYFIAIYAFSVSDLKQRKFWDWDSKALNPGNQHVQNRVAPTTLNLCHDTKPLKLGNVLRSTIKLNWENLLYSKSMCKWEAIIILALGRVSDSAPSRINSSVDPAN